VNRFGVKSWINSGHLAHVLYPYDKAREGCILCNKVAGADDVEYVIAHSEYVFLTLNLYPYNNGHLMVVPYEHVDSQEAMPAEADRPDGDY
jgi:ATP adenylyltransferase